MIAVFKALAEENRLRILSLLLKGELCVCEIEYCLGMSQTNVSRHLSVLRRCNLIRGNKHAQWKYYGIHDAFARDNPELWAFLRRNLPHMPTYEADMAALGTCKRMNLCEQPEK